MQKPFIIVFEGVDNSGKTTHARQLFNALCRKKYSTDIINFPNRHTPIGSLIDKVLKKELTIHEPHALHLLFSANRWETMNFINKQDIVIVDRYIFSGCAYSMAHGLDVEWCRQSDNGLPKADVVFYFDRTFTSSPDKTELFENEMFQQKVYKEFESMKNSFVLIDTKNKSIAENHDFIVSYVEKILILHDITSLTH